MSTKRHVLAAVLMIGIAVGCSTSPSADVAPPSSGSAVPTTTRKPGTTPVGGGATIVLVADEPLGDEADATATVLQRRLDGLDEPGATIAVSGDKVTITGVSSDRVAAVTRELVRPGVLLFRPVTAQPVPDATTNGPCADPTACPSRGSTPGRRSDPAAAVVVAGAPDSDSAGQRFPLGPALLSGDSLARTTAKMNPNGGWDVNPQFQPGPNGIDRFNAAAKQCFEKAATCPTGRLAMVLDDEVLSAPNINAPSFTADQIQISGGFTEQSAKTLAALLNSRPLPVGLRVSA